MIRFGIAAFICNELYPSPEFEITFSRASKVRASYREHSYKGLVTTNFHLGSEGLTLPGTSQGANVLYIPRLLEK